MAREGRVPVRQVLTARPVIHLLFLFFLTPVACFPSPALQYLY
jgi:hypothetical protein